MKKNQKTIFMIIGILAIIVLGFGVTYAWLTLTLNGTKNNVLKIGTLSLVLDDATGEGINIEGTVPMLDEVGITLDPYTFTLTNNGTIESEYTIYFDDVELETGETRVDDSKIKYSLLRDGETVNTALVSSIGTHPDRILETGKIGVNESHNYELILWVDSEAGNEVMGKVFRGKIRVEASQVIQKAPTDASCFEFDSTTGSITKFICAPYVIAVMPEIGVVGTVENTNSINNITDVVIPKTIDGVAVTAIEHEAFYGNHLTSITIPNSVTTIGPGALNDNQLPDDQAFIYKRSSDGSEDKTVLIGYGGAKRGNVSIPNNVTKIDASAFSSNQLTSVTIPNSVTIIEEGAFAINQLTSVIIPSSVTSIGDGAFSNNPLTSVTIKGKANSASFAHYGDLIWSWAAGYSDDNITWNG